MSNFNNYNNVSAPFYVVVIPGNTGSSINANQNLYGGTLQSSTSPTLASSPVGNPNLMEGLFSMFSMMLEMMMGSGVSTSSGGSSSGGSSGTSTVANSLARQNLQSIFNYYNEPDPTLKNIDKPPPPPAPDDGSGDE